ncbi:protein kinase [Lujinxingia vulgaris]|uniref:Protein kinase n=1 Tax=Lujinxingia vulgaris TaxID=2600176 RepID=A0A5C6XHQ5_9DELT|nr:serine/threonine-protein kinase [Lujinxingia vulgaris]TXD39404.1 protein kinase [Lujinxingia vulgaris]
MSRIICSEFELVAPIGKGGMGQVWEGRHLASRVDVAVKILHPEVVTDAEYRRTFEAELRAVAALDHPNIVTLLDYGSVAASTARQSGGALVEGCPYLVMEYARGGALIDHLSHMEWPELKALLLQMLDALAHAHARGLIHRDLKPENVLVGCGPDWSLKLTDFGLVHVDSTFDDEGKVGKVWGTPQYMAPEQLRGFWRDYGPWTDLYGLGCMAYELVSACWPFEGASPWQIAARHLKEPVPALKPRFEVPEGLQAWVEKMMAKRTCDRFQRAADAAWALANLTLPGEGEAGGPLFDAAVSWYDRERDADDAFRASHTTVILPHLHAGATRRSSTASLNAGDWGDALEEAAATCDEPVSPGPPLPLSWRRGQEAAISNELIGISLGLFGLRAIPLVDREEERDKLWSLLHGVHRSRRARMVLIEGAAGTGKSQLARWLCERAEEVGGAVALEAWHSPVQGPRDGIVPMLSRHLGCVHLPPGDALSRLERVCAPLDVNNPRMLQGLAQLVAAPERKTEGAKSMRLTTQSDRFSVIYHYLKRLAAQRPVILWLDDVAWGQEAIDLAGYIDVMQTHDPAAILVVMTARTEALTERTAEQHVLGALEQRGMLRLPLDALATEDGEALVRTLLRLDHELAEHVLQRVGGVPLFAVQLVADWVARGKLVMGREGFVLRPGADIAIPDGLHALWDERVRAFAGPIDGPVIQQLEVAATLGVVIELEELRAVCERAGLPAPDDLGPRLTDASLAQRHDEGWRFAHGLLQESLERSAREAGRWPRWNQAAADVLEQRYSLSAPGVAERVAWHWIEGHRADRAMTPLRFAIAQAIQRSEYPHAEELIAWREGLAESLEERTGRRAALQCAVDRAWLAAARADYGLCRALAETAQRQAATLGFNGVAAEAASWAGVAARHAGDLERAQSLLKQARDVFKARSASRELARVELEGGRVAELSGDLDAAHRRLERARDAYARQGDAYGQARALNALGDVARKAGDVEASRVATVEAMRLFESVGNLSGVADCLNDLAERSRLQGHLERARERAEEALKLYEAMGSNEQFAVRLNLALIALRSGDPSRALHLCAPLDDAFERAAQVAPRAQVLATTLAAQARLGRWRELLATISTRDPVLCGAALNAFGVYELFEEACEVANVHGQTEVVEALRRLMKNLHGDFDGLNIESSRVSDEPQ